MIVLYSGLPLATHRNSDFSFHLLDFEASNKFSVEYDECEPISIVIYVDFFFHFFSPRDSAGGLGFKMVEYVLGGSPTNKESPLSNIESRFSGLKFDEGDKVSW